MCAHCKVSMLLRSVGILSRESSGLTYRYPCDSKHLCSAQPAALRMASAQRHCCSPAAAQTWCPQSGLTACTTQMQPIATHLDAMLLVPGGQAMPDNDDLLFIL